MDYKNIVRKSKQKIMRFVMISIDVPIENVMFSNQKCYVMEGFGGMPLHLSPIFSFYEEYINGNEQKAFERFSKWYSSLISKYFTVSKKQGGMYQGSLYKLIQQNHENNNIQFNEIDDGNPNLINISIEQQVRERFALAESIIRDGYDLNSSDPIVALKRGSDFILLNGHHRASILAVLGEDILPQVYVVEGKFKIFLYKLYEEMHYCLREKGANSI